MATWRVGGREEAEVYEVWGKFTTWARFGGEEGRAISGKRGPNPEKFDKRTRPHPSSLFPTTLPMPQTAPFTPDRTPPPRNDVMGVVCGGVPRGQWPLRGVLIPETYQKNNQKDQKEIEKKDKRTTWREKMTS